MPAHTDPPTEQDSVAETDGGPVVYREVLRHPWWAWLLAVAAAAFLGTAYLFALGTLAGTAVFAAILALGIWLLIRTTALITIDERTFRAGRARLPLEFVGTVEALDAPAALAARGRDADPRAFLLLRTGYSARAVRVEVTDPRDPHPYWLVSSKHPEQLASAMMNASAGHTATGAPGPDPH